MVAKTIIEEDNNNPLQIIPDDELVIGEIPSALEDFMAENGIGKQTYQCQIKRRPAGGGMPQPLPGIYKDLYPSHEEIGKKWGPGTYVYSFSWRFTDADHKKKNKLKEHDIELGTEWEAINRKWNRKERILENKEVQKLKSDAQLDAALEGDIGASKSEIGSLKEAAHTLRDINSILTPGGAVPVAQNNDTKMFEVIMSQQAESSRNMMTLMMGMMKSSNDMVIAMMTNNKPESGGNQFKEAMEMVTNLVDLKAAIAPEKVTVLDKFLGVMEGVLPQIIKAAKEHGIKAAQENPMVNMTRESQQFKDVMGDPEQWQYMVNNLINEHGIEDTNLVLQTMKVPLEVTKDGKIIPRMEKKEEQTPAQPPAEETIITPPPGAAQVNTGPLPGQEEDEVEGVGDA